MRIGALRGVGGMKVNIKACLLVSILAACFPTASRTQTVTYNYAKGVNFVEFKTYDWVNIGDAGATDPALDTDIRAVIDAQLSIKGLAKSHEGAQIIIAYQACISRDEDIRAY